MHAVQSRLFQSDSWQYSVYGMHDGVHNDGRCCDRFKCLWRLCRWIWRCQCWRIKWVCSMRSRLLQSHSWQYSVHGMHDRIYDDGWYGYWSNRP